MKRDFFSYSLPAVVRIAVDAERGFAASDGEDGSAELPPVYGSGDDGYEY